MATICELIWGLSLMWYHCAGSYPKFLIARWSPNFPDQMFAEVYGRGGSAWCIYIYTFYFLLPWRTTELPVINGKQLLFLLSQFNLYPMANQLNESPCGYRILPKPDCSTVTSVKLLTFGVPCIFHTCLSWSVSWPEVNFVLQVNIWILSKCKMN